MNESQHNAVEVNNLEKRFGKFIAVNHISFEVAKGEVFGFLGPNGAGKSTTIRMLCGIIPPTSGTGHVGGFDIVSQRYKIKETIGYMSQKFSLYADLTIEENIDFYSGIYKLSKQKKKIRKEWILQMTGLEEIKSSLTGTISTGFKQRLAFGCAVIHEPKIVFLDEPTSGVDPIARKHFWELVRQMASSGVTIFVTTHYMDDADNCDRISLIYNGDIIAMGSPKELKQNLAKENEKEISLEDVFVSLIENHNQKVNNNENPKS